MVCKFKPVTPNLTKPQKFIAKLTPNYTGIKANYCGV